jgi:hypothetical protein
MVKRAGIASGVTLAFVFLGGTSNAPHPLHTTLTEVVQPNDAKPMTATIRGFADDLTLGAARHAGRDTSALRGAAGDSLIASYLAGTLRFSDQHGRAIRLTLRGVRRTADLLWFSFETTGVATLAGGRVANTTLCEIHRDQVNIVQFKRPGRARSLVFMPGDGAKAVP